MAGPLLGYGIAITVDGETWHHGDSIAPDVESVRQAAEEEAAESGGFEEMRDALPGLKVRITEIRAVEALD